MCLVWLADVTAMATDVIATYISSVLADVIAIVVDVMTTQGVYIVWQMVSHMCGWWNCHMSALSATIAMQYNLQTSGITSATMATTSATYTGKK